MYSLTELHPANAGR